MFKNITLLLIRFKVEYTEATPLSETWKSCTRDERDEWIATGLRPRTRYRFRLRLQYVANAPPYYWPHDDRFTYETLGKFFIFSWFYPWKVTRKQLIMNAT